MALTWFVIRNKASCSWSCHLFFIILWTHIGWVLLVNRYLAFKVLTSRLPPCVFTSCTFFLDLPRCSISGKMTIHLSFPHFQNNNNAILRHEGRISRSERGGCHGDEGILAHHLMYLLYLDYNSLSFHDYLWDV